MPRTSSHLSKKHKVFHAQPLPAPLMVPVTTTTHFVHNTPAVMSAHHFPHISGCFQAPATPFHSRFFCKLPLSLHSSPYNTASKTWPGTICSRTASQYFSLCPNSARGPLSTHSTGHISLRQPFTACFGTTATCVSQGTSEPLPVSG